MRRSTGRRRTSTENGVAITDTVMKEDRISSLPDSIISHILTYLPLQTAVRTSLLLKRWTSLWTSIPDLSFKDQGDGCWFRGNSAFKEFVDTFLRLYSLDVVNKFSLDLCCIFYYYDDKLPAWLCFAAHHSVKEVDLHFRGEGQVLPLDFCVSRSLCKLSLRCPIFWISEQVSWPSLRYMYLHIEDVETDTIKKILSGCPVLEELKFTNCEGMTLDVSPSVSMKKLVIDHTFDDKEAIRDWLDNNFEDNQEFRICGGGGLRCLEFSGYLLLGARYHLENLSSLAEAKVEFNLDYGLYEFEGDLVNDNPIRGIVGGLCHVEKLSLNAESFLVLSLSKDKTPSSTLAAFTRLRNLVLTTYFSKLDLIGLASMLCRTPKLEMLHINLDLSSRPKHFPIGRFKNYCISQAHGETAMECLTLHLKTVRVVGFTQSHHKSGNLLQFLEFILSNALVLEELSVTAHKSLQSNKLGTDSWLKTTEALLSFHRASPSAKVIFT